MVRGAAKPKAGPNERWTLTPEPQTQTLNAPPVAFCTEVQEPSLTQAGLGSLAIPRWGLPDSPPTSI